MSLTPVVLADLGTLSKLPLELIYEILEYLDMPSAAKFTRVNRQAQFILWSDKHYLFLRQCLFQRLSRYRRAGNFRVAESLLKDFSYHALSRAILDAKCFECTTIPFFRLYIDPRDRKVRCGWCNRGENVKEMFIDIKSSWAEANEKFPLRLEEGQLILTDGRITSWDAWVEWAMDSICSGFYPVNNI
ncbi:hypothetical protein F4678DRAFT_460466 [Xylaria arbuscula]|nr:hypothetical protein F4678DRAFT_460466 [Xylaria arbuscula]